MKKFIKVIKIIIGLIFGVSALSMFSFIPYEGIMNKHFGIGIFQGLVAYFLFKSAFKAPQEEASSNDS